MGYAILDGRLVGKCLIYTETWGSEGVNLKDVLGRCVPGWGLEVGVCFWLRRWMVRTTTVVEAEWEWEWYFSHFQSADHRFLHICFFLLRVSLSFWWARRFFLLWYLLLLQLFSNSCSALLTPLTPKTVISTHITPLPRNLCWW